MHFSFLLYFPVIGCFLTCFKKIFLGLTSSENKIKYFNDFQKKNHLIITLMARYTVIIYISNIYRYILILMVKLLTISNITSTFYLPYQPSCNITPRRGGSALAHTGSNSSHPYASIKQHSQRSSSNVFNMQGFNHRPK